MSEPKILFAPLFDTVVNALKTEPLLPCVGRTYASAANARLSRTQECGDFFSLSSWRRSGQACIARDHAVLHFDGAAHGINYAADSTMVPSPVRGDGQASAVRVAVGQVVWPEEARVVLATPASLSPCDEAN
jgi:hypothetical protein